MPLRVINSSELLLNWNKQVQRSLNLSYQDNLENYVQQVLSLLACVTFFQGSKLPVTGVHMLY